MKTNATIRDLLAFPILMLGYALLFIGIWIGTRWTTEKVLWTFPNIKG